MQVPPKPARPPRNQRWWSTVRPAASEIRRAGAPPLRLFNFFGRARVESRPLVLQGEHSQAGVYLDTSAPPRSPVSVRREAISTTTNRRAPMTVHDSPSSMPLRELSESNVQVPRRPTPPSSAPPRARRPRVADKENVQEQCRIIPSLHTPHPPARLREHVAPPMSYRARRLSHAREVVTPVAVMVA